MNIGIDIDGVIIDTIAFVSKELTGYLGRTVTPDDVAHRLGSIEGVERIFMEKGEHLLCSLEPVSDAAEVINALYEKNKIYLISARFEIHYQVTLQWLEKHCFRYNGVIFSQGKSKSDICRRNKIDLFIEDSLHNALELSDMGIDVILLRTDYNRALTRENITYCDGWQDIRRVIEERTIV